MDRMYAVILSDLQLGDELQIKPYHHPHAECVMCLHVLL